jgi:hypothetical protein
VVNGAITEVNEELLKHQKLIDSRLPKGVIYYPPGDEVIKSTVSKMAESKKKLAAKLHKIAVEIEEGNM